VIQWYTEVLKKYTVFNGRSGRAEFWYFTLVNFIVLLVLSIIGQFIGRPIATGLIVLYELFILLPSIGVGIRRLHDSNKSGWWLLLGFVPAIGGLILLILFILDSDPGDNQYGPHPSATVLQTA
jgi:uncharacterized membrane protein YhaH (DUF805 family)